MKTQRRRDRAGAARNPVRTSVNSNNGEVVDGELSDVEAMSDGGLANGAESHLDENETAVASSNGRDDGNGSMAGGETGNRNDPTATQTRTIVNLPRRRSRFVPEEEPVAPPPARTPIPAPPPVPTSSLPARAGGVALPPRSKGLKQAAASVETAPSAPFGPSARSGQAPRQAPRMDASRGATAASVVPDESLVTRAFRLIVTYENIIYLTIFGLAIVSRFWDVGNRGIHHDESLHSVYSRNLYIGSGYTHDPMMHGPLQFNFISVMFWLFGTSDTTTRFASVLCGIFVVMSPFFLRKQMGRWPALVASFLFLVAPTILYFSRMAREDAIYSGMEMIMIVGLWRFVSTRKPADFFIFMAGLSLMFTIKETAYLTFAVMAVFFVVMFAFQAGYAILGALGGYGVLMGALYLFVSNGMKNGAIQKLPDIPATNPDYNTIMTFVGLLFAHPLVQGAIAATLLFVAVLAGLFISQRRRVQAEAEIVAEPVVRRRPIRTANGAPTVPVRSAALPSRRMRPAAEVVVDEVPSATDGMVASTNGHVDEEVVSSPDGFEGGPVDERDDLGGMEATEVWDPRRLDPKPGSFLGRYQPGSIPYLVGSLFSRPAVLLIGFLIAAAIFIVLYSVFFTDVPRGILSGLFASLGYWMAQQGVARGDQPWYYYFLIVPLYQPIAVFFSIVATVFFAVKGVKGLLRRREERYYSGEPGLSLFNIDRTVPFAKFSVLLPLFLIWWCLAALILYSWAGEKMPWLTMHLTRPAILLASLFLGALVASIITRRQERLAWAASNDYYGYTPAPVPVAETLALPPRRPSQAPPISSRRRFEAGGTANAYVASAPRRRAAVARMGPREQDPPWVAWNRPDSLFPALSFLVLFVLLAFAWGLKMNALTAKTDMASWGQSWIYPGLMVILTIAYAVWLGPSRAARYLAVAIFSVMFVYEFKSTTALSYQHPDVPIEMATYVQTSPDVTRSVRELNTYSNFATGGQNIKVAYDSFTSWPFEWYLRDFKNKQFIGDGTPPAGPDMPVMFLEYAKHNNDAALSDYVLQRYAMRWWFPEETYKNDFIPGLDYHNSPVGSQIGAAINSTVSSVTDPGRMSALWSYLLFRKLPKPLGSEDMIVAVRKDIAQEWHYLQYEPPVMYDLPPVVRDPNAK